MSDIYTGEEKELVKKLVSKQMAVYKQFGGSAMTFVTLTPETDSHSTDLKLKNGPVESFVLTAVQEDACFE